MTKRILSVALLGALSMGFTGCVGGQPSKPISFYKPMKESIIVTSKQKGFIENGALRLTNGDTIYDSEGDIKASFTLNDKVFYLLEVKSQNLYKLKDSSKKTIKKFSANAVSWFVGNNEIVLAVSLNGNSKIGLYDNVYKFNGKDIKLINKNLDLSNGTYRSRGRTQYKRVSKTGMYYIETWYSKDSYLNQQVITNILTNKKIVNEQIKTNYEADLYPMFIGAVNGKIYYTYQRGMLSGDYFLEVLDTKTNKVLTLAMDSNFDSSDTKKKMQILKSGNQVVLKIFDNPKLKSEFTIFKHTKKLVSKYENEPAKFISLNTLKEVKGVSKDFSPIPLFSSYSNAGGGHTKDTYITFSMSDLTSKYIKDIKKRALKPLF